MIPIEKITPLNELVEDFISNEGLKKIIINLDELFFIFITNVGDECYDEKSLSFTYKYIKDFLMSIEKNKNVLNETSYLNELIEDLLSIDSIKNTIYNFSDIYFHYNVIDADSENINNEERINISWTYKYLKDFLMSLEPYEKERNQRLGIEFNKN